MSPGLRSFALRAGCLYVWLFCLPTPLDSLPGIDEHVSDFFTALWRPLIELAGSLLHVEVPPFEVTGSGDTTAEWLRLFVQVVLSLALGLVWAFDTRRTRDEVLADVTRDYLRLSLMVVMLSYGMSKVLLEQMPLNEDQFVVDFTASSPMGFLWRFMAVSPEYQRFAGLGEVVGGLLLLSRRTTTLGALVSAGVMTNVVLLNFCFDVPVKLFSSHLLVFALVLAAPDGWRLARVLVFNRVAPSRDLSPKWARSGWRQFAFSCVMLLLAATEVVLRPLKPVQEEPLEVAPFGRYTVVRQEGTSLAWQRVRLNGWRLSVLGADGVWRWHPLSKLDEAAHTFELGLDALDEAAKTTITWSHEGPYLVLRGRWREQPITLRLIRLEVRQGELLDRGFHWVQEFPYNR